MNKTRWHFIAASILAFGFFLPGCRNQAPQSASPEAAGETAPTSITLTAEAAQTVGIKTEEAGFKPVIRKIHAPGELMFNPKKVAHMTARTSGRVEQLYAYQGDRVAKGQTLLTFYSQDFLTLQSEFLQALEQTKRSGAEPEEKAAAQALLDPGDRLPGHGLRLLAGFAPGDKEDQVLQVLRSLAQLLPQGGGDDDVGAEPVIEVFAEAPGGDLPGQVAVGGRDQLAGEATVGGVAQALESALLQDAQELDLQGRGQLADLVQEDGAPGPASLQPARAVLQGAGEGPPPVAEQLGLDERRREGGEVEGVEGAGEVPGEPLPGGVVGQEAGGGKGPGDQLLARPRGPGHQRGYFAHPGVEGALIALDVVGEDGLPDRPAQARRGQRRAHQVAEDAAEGAADLEAAGQQVGGRGPAGQGRAGGGQKVLGVAEELPGVGQPAAARAAGGGLVYRLLELRPVAVVEQVEDQVRVELLVRRGGAGAFPQAPAQGGGQGLDALAQAQDVGRLLGLVRADVPDGPRRDEILPQGLPLELDPLGQELVAVGDLRDRLGQAPLVGLQKNQGNLPSEIV